MTRRAINAFCDRRRFVRATCSAILLIAKLCSITCSWRVESRYAFCARCKLPSSCVISASTWRACACFALTEGSPVAVPAAIHAAAMTRTSAGACRLKTVITDSRDWFAASAPEGPVRHKFRRLAGVSDSRNQVRRANLLHLCHESAQTSLVVDRTKCPEISAFTVLRSRPRERPEDTICGATRRCLDGDRPRRRLRRGGRRPRRFAEKSGEHAAIAYTPRAARSLRARYTLPNRSTPACFARDTSRAPAPSAVVARATTFRDQAHVESVTAATRRESAHALQAG